MARSEWLQLMLGEHPLWAGIAAAYRETVRAFLLHFEHELLRQAPYTAPLRLASGSVGNFFFTGARLFFNSLEAAIFVFSRVAKISEHARVLPCILPAPSGAGFTLAARLRDGTRIIGQVPLLSFPSRALVSRSIWAACSHCRSAAAAIVRARV